MDKKEGEKNVRLLGLVSFLNDMSSEMINPVLPFFITSLGGGGAALGVIGGLRDSLSSLLKIFFGYISDKIGRKKIFLFFGYFISGFFKFLIAFSVSWVFVMLFLALERFGKGIRDAPRDAIVADSMPHNLGKAFGIMRAMDSGGAVVGSIITLLLYWLLKIDFKPIIIIAAILSFISLLPISGVKEKNVKTVNNLNVSFRKLSSRLRFFLVVAALYSLANFSYMFFVLKAQNAFLPESSSLMTAAVLAIFLYILYNIFYSSFSLPFGKLGDKMGNKRVLMMGYTAFLVTTVGFVFAKTFVEFIFLFILYGLTYAITEANHRAFIAKLAPKHMKATALGTFYTITGLCALPSSIIAGLLWNKSTTLTFQYGAGVSLLCIILLGLFWRKI